MTNIHIAIVQLLILGIITERAAELFVDSKFFSLMHEKFRKFLYKPDQPPPDTRWHRFLVWLDNLTSCKYCCSVWIGYEFALFAPTVWPNIFWNWFILGLLIHGLSNAYHVIFERMRLGRVRTYDILIKRPAPEVVEE